MDLSIYGGTGIIGSYYNKLFPSQLVLRDEHAPKNDNVLYFISTTDNSSFLEDPLLDVNTNLVALMERLNACQKNNIKTFNFISSWYVYGPQHIYPNEDSSCSPNGFYSITKHTAERLVQEYCPAYDIDYRILRLGNVYGGPDYGNKKRNALHYLINQLKEDKDIWIHRQISRDFIHIMDTCIAINLICKKGQLNTIYNVGTGKDLELLNALMFCKNILKSYGEVIPKDTPAHYNQAVKFSLDCNRLELLGFKPTINIYEGLTDLCLHRRFCTPDPTLMEQKLKLLFPT